MPRSKNSGIPAFKISFFLPNYWPTWVFLALMRTSICLPFAIQVLIGKILGRLIYHIVPNRKKIARTNIRLCFPNLSDAELIQLTKEHFENVGISIFETAMAWWASDARLKKLHYVHGLQNLNENKNQKQPLILFSAHFSATDLGARLLSLHLNFQAMYKPAKNKLYDYMMYRSRARAYKVVDNANVKLFIKNIKNGYTSWYAPDQNLKREDHLFVNFFNVPTLSITAPSRIAKLVNAKAISYFPIRRKNKYELTFTPTLSDFPSQNIDIDLLTINKSLEEGIKLAPSQYLWTHKRFHKLPDGSDRQYK